MTKDDTLKIKVSEKILQKGIKIKVQGEQWPVLILVVLSYITIFSIAITTQ